MTENHLSVLKLKPSSLLRRLSCRGTVEHPTRGRGRCQLKRQPTHPEITVPPGRGDTPLGTSDRNRGGGSKTFKYLANWFVKNESPVRFSPRFWSHRRNTAFLRQSGSEGIPTWENDGARLVLAGFPRRNTFHPAAELYWEYPDAHTEEQEVRGNELL